MVLTVVPWCSPLPRMRLTSYPSTRPWNRTARSCMVTYHRSSGSWPSRWVHVLYVMWLHPWAVPLTARTRSQAGCRFELNTSSRLGDCLIFGVGTCSWAGYGLGLIPILRYGIVWLQNSTPAVFVRMSALFMTGHVFLVCVWCAHLWNCFKVLYYASLDPQCMLPMRSLYGCTYARYLCMSLHMHTIVHTYSAYMHTCTPANLFVHIIMRSMYGRL